MIVAPVVNWHLRDQKWVFIVEFLLIRHQELFMDTIISTKGQIVIPKRLRDQWGLTSGSRVKIESLSLIHI